MNRIATYTLLGSALFSFPAFAAWQTPVVPTQAIAQQQAAAPALTATIRDPFYKITTKDVGNAVAEQLQIQAVVPKAEVLMAPGTPSQMYQSDRAVKVVIHALQVDSKAKRWQAEAHFVSGNKTESVVPVAGTYGTLIDVPVLSRQLNKSDIIEEKDIQIVPVAERLLRKDTVTDPKTLVGLSPRMGISPNRPIHGNEVSLPNVIKKGDLIEMTFNTPHIHIKATGVALEDGATGQTIRVKNQKSERAISARVVAAGRVEVNNSASL
jgi:flagella basal body P-ring formation protein FlgA